MCIRDRLRAPYQQYGYSFLADTDEAYRERTEEDPPAFPVMPDKPDYTNKVLALQTKDDLKHFNNCTDIVKAGIKLLETVFPECLHAVRSNKGLPPNFTLKQAFNAIIESCLNPRTKRNEFRKYTKAITNLQYTHQPCTTGLIQYLRQLEDLRAMQKIVESNPGATISYEDLWEQAHTEIRYNTGGRTDLVEELLDKWKAQLPVTATTGYEKWRNFRQFYTAKLKDYDEAGYTTAKTRHAKSIIPEQAAFNEQTTAGFLNVQEQLDDLSLAFSAFSHRSPQKEPPTGPPSYVHEGATAASTITPNDQSLRILMEERSKNERIRQIERSNHEKERQLWEQEKKAMEQRLAACTTGSSGGFSSATDQRIMQRDSHGHKWFKVAHYCSKHGYNISHSNDNCRDREKSSGSPWSPGATHQDHKGGSNNHEKHYNHWFNPHTKHYSESLP